MDFTKVSQNAYYVLEDLLTDMKCAPNRKTRLYFWSYANLRALGSTKGNICKLARIKVTEAKPENI